MSMARERSELMARERSELMEAEARAQRGPNEVRHR
ncbi:hypothetical protein BH09ACT11_BH09ACT11_16160 [soil metagenome]